MARAIDVLLLSTIVLAIEPPAFCDKADDYNRRGLAKLSVANTRGAVADFTKAIQLRPNFAEAYVNRGNARFGGRAKVTRDRVIYDDQATSAAFLDYTKAIQLNPDLWAAYSGLGSYEASKNHFDGAITNYTKAIELVQAGIDPIPQIQANAPWRQAPKRKDQRLIRLQTELQLAYIKRGDEKKAIKDFDGAVADYTKAGEIKTGSGSQTSKDRLDGLAKELGWKGERFRILIRGASNTAQAEAVVVLNVSWMFSGNEKNNGGAFAPDAHLSKMVGTSGIAGAASGPVALAFSGLYKKAADPFYVYFTVGEGDLRLWWSRDGKSAISDQATLVQLSPAWIAASKELPATPEHPAGGISISSHTPNGGPLAFFIEFTGQSTIKGMGTQ